MDHDAQLLMLGGESLRLLPDRALFWEAASTLILADLHLGKSEEFRAAGVPLPAGETETDLTRVAHLVERTGAGRLLILGDLFHGRAATSAPMLERLKNWRGRHPDLDLELVPGNHDRHTRQWPEALRIHLLPEGHREGPFAFFHYPGKPGAEKAPVNLAGHLHPAVRLKEDGGPAMVLPCFHQAGSWLTLPAFGSFTGSARIQPAHTDRVFAIVEERLLEIPVALCR